MKPRTDPLALVRVAELRHAEQITVLINDAFRIAERSFVDQDRIDTAEVRDLFQKGSFLITEDNESLIGAVYIEPREDRTYLGLLSVDPAKQGTGLGSLLMNAAEQHARTTGSLYMDILIVNLREELPDFYQKRGYVETGTSEFPEDINLKLPCHFINMSKKL
jgi:GNAT superfamily N-acetyltransferase